MKKIITVFILILFVFGFINIKSVLSDVTVRNIVLSPPTINQVCEVKIYFILSKGIPGGGKIYVKFPQGFYVPQTITNLSSIDIGGNQPLSVSVDGNVIAITLSQVILAYQGAPDGNPLTFSSNIGIKTPSNPDTYTFEIWTSEEPVHTTCDVFVGLGGSGTTVSNLVATVDNPKAGASTSYTISFIISSSASALVTQADFVDIYFPKGTLLSDTFDPSDVIFNNKECSKVEKRDRALRVYVPENWAILYSGTVIIKKDFGIRNPEFTGKYAIQVSTSKDTGLATSVFYTIIGTPIQNLSVSVSPSSQLNITELTIKFKQSAQSSLEKDKSKINIKFPNEFTLPSNIKPGAVMVNDTLCVKVTRDENLISVYSPINIDANTEINLVFKKEFGIVNPQNTGSYEFQVSTSSDAELVSAFVTITPSTISDVDVTLSNTSAGQISAYTITFYTGANGRLDPGIDRINIVFPLGTTIPSVIPNSAVLINGTPTTLIEKNGTTITITPPLTINASSFVTVEFKESAGIRNPVIAGSYTLNVFTSKEQTYIQSAPYVIKNVPVTTVLISPSQPDGTNGFYETQPSITFLATSATDPNPVIYYYFDNNQPVVYSGSLVVAPEGIHTLYYYAVDKEAHKEEIRSVQIKLDTIPPQIVVIFPQDNSVLNSKTLVVKGVVDVGSMVKVNGNSVTVDGLGNFEASVEVSSSPQLINITATDPAGNSAQKTLTVYLDTTPPNLTIVKPVMFQQVSKLPLIVEGMTEKGAKVTINGNVAEVKDDGTFSFALQTLPEGELAVIEIVSTDAAGNSIKKTMSVKYSKSIVMKLQVGNKTALINNETYSLEAAPTITSGRTMVPLRFVGEAFSAEFTYDSVFKIIDINFGSDKIKMQIGKNIAFVNGKEIKLDVAPYIVNGRTLVPIRFISETFGAEVVWDGTTKTVTIIYPKP